MRVEPAVRSRVAWGLVGLGVLLVLVFFAALPRIHGFEHTCDAEFSAPRLAGDGWWAIRGAQLSDFEPAYDPINRTTLVAPGCGHNDAGVLVRVRGDQRHFDDSRDHLVLSGNGVTGATTTMEVERKWGGDNKTYHVLEGTFTARSRLPHALAFSGGLVGLAAGIGLLRPMHPLAARSLPVAATAGTAFALLGLAADLGLVLFLMVAPVMPFVALAGFVGTITERHRKWWFWAGLFAFALAWWVTFVSFLGAFPLTPDAQPSFRSPRPTPFYRRTSPATCRESTPA